jgi:HD-GYP domain-containing protein (c-di-GMP phosphodiesterase class II)
MINHQDILAVLNSQLPLKEKFVGAHKVMQEKFPFIARIALIMYDSETNVLKTYTHSCGEDRPLERYQTSLDDAPSLKEIVDTGRPRVVNDMSVFQDGEHFHTRHIASQGYKASYTLPIFHNDEFLGLIFFNSYEKNVFTEQNLHEIDVYGHLVALLVINELATMRILNAAIKTTGRITHIRDPETGSHLDRMSRFSHLIAMAIAEKHHLNDEYIEHILRFAPLHDIGKIAIPDSILLKPGKLDDEERKTMQTHARKGRELIDEVIDNFGLKLIGNIHVLRNIVEFHHEAIDGTGYPDGKAGDDIPLEARIIAVADVFDALTSARPYKEAWPNEKAFALLRELAGKKLDQDCVEALIANRETVEEIQQRYQEDYYG